METPIFNRTHQCSFILIFLKSISPVPDPFGRFSSPYGQSAVVFSDSSGHHYYESGSAAKIILPIPITSGTPHPVTMPDHLKGTLMVSSPKLTSNSSGLISRSQ
jgi:hypothetical protein